MKALLLVFVGGGLGSSVRYLLSRWISTLHAVTFPYGTLVVNIVACFVLGVVVGLFDNKQLLTADARIFWAIGFCGGFSTFSTFSYETLSLYQQGNSLSALIYVGASLIGCLVATVAGIRVAS